MPTDRIHFDQPRAGLQRLAARFGGHAYDLHRHETYAVGLTLWGAQSFHYRGGVRTSRGGQVMVIHPDEAHDGHAGVADGFAYRMLYVDPAAVTAALGSGSTPFVTDVVANDPVLADLVGEAFADFRARWSQSPRTPWSNAWPSASPNAATASCHGVAAPQRSRRLPAPATS